jgi:DNA-binding NarL/FixJ family response regulator
MFRTPVRLVIADDQPVVLHGLISLVGSDRSFTIVASCSNGTESISIIRTLRPDVALLDMSMPGLNGLEILAIVRAEDLPTRIVFLTASIQDHGVTAAAVRGVHGIVFKDCSPDALLHGLREVASGRKWLPTALIDGAVLSETEGEDRSAAFGALTDREREVMRLAAQGLSNKQIARHLNVCDGTIKVHLQNVYRKVAVRNRTALAALAISYRDALSGLGVTARRPIVQNRRSGRLIINHPAVRGNPPTGKSDSLSKSVEARSAEPSDICHGRTATAAAIEDRRHR